MKQKISPFFGLHGGRVYKNDSIYTLLYNPDKWIIIVSLILFTPQLVTRQTFQFLKSCDKKNLTSAQWLFVITFEHDEWK